MTDQEALDCEDRYLVGQIESLQREYMAAAKPLVDRLVYIRSLKPVPPFIWVIAPAHESSPSP